MKKIQKPLEEVTCSDEEQSNEDGLSFDSSGEDDCLENKEHVRDSDNYMSESNNLQENPKKEKVIIWCMTSKIRGTKQHGGGNTASKLN